MVTSYPLGTPLVRLRAIITELIPPGSEVQLTLTPPGGGRAFVESGDKYVIIEQRVLTGTTLIGQDLILEEDIPVLARPAKWRVEIKHRDQGNTKATWAAPISRDFIVDPSSVGTVIPVASLEGSAVVPSMSNTLTTSLADARYAFKGEAGGSGLTDATAVALEAGEQPTASIVGGVLTLGIPGGGATGPKGDTGDPGVTSATANTLAAGSAATVSLANGVLTIGVPRGADGTGGGGSTLTIAQLTEKAGY